MKILFKYLFLILAFSLFFYSVVFAETDLRTKYNACFGLEDYEGCLKIINTFIASEPNSLEFRRERAKMLAATNRKDDFLAELVAIRSIPDGKAIETIWEIIKHKLVSHEYSEIARQLFLAKSDNILISNWPKKSMYSKGVVVINKTIDTGSSKNHQNNYQTSKSLPQPISQKKETNKSSGFSGFQFSEMSLKDAEKSDIKIVNFDALNSMPSSFLKKEVTCLAVLNGISEDSYSFFLSVTSDTGVRNSGIPFVVGKGTGLEYDFISKLLKVKGSHIVFSGIVLNGYPDRRPIFIIKKAIAITSYFNY